MISENDSNINKETFTNEGEKTTIEETKEESPTTVDTKKDEEIKATSIEETNALKEDNDDDEEEEEQIKNEMHDVSSKSESEQTEDQHDTQALFDQPIIVEGKRSRKPTLRLEISELTPTKKELSIPNGRGKPLGEIEYINYQISHASTDALSRMRQICFGRRGNKATIRKNLREFKGFEFERNSDEYQKYLSNLTKLKKDQLRSISNILGLPSTGRNTDHAERILNFLIEPIDEGKRIPGKKSSIRNSKKRSTNSKESSDKDQETDKQKIENGKDEHGEDYVYKPGKKSSNKRSSNHQNSTNNKRKKDILIKSESTKNDEIVKTNGNDINNSKLTEKSEENQAIINNTEQDII